jgi:hypothetical protein
MGARMTAAGLTILVLLASEGVVRALTLAELVSARETYDGKVVTVTGTVEQPVPVGSESLYNLRDGAAKISVISRTSPPAAGASLTVTGTIHVFQEGDGGPEATTFPVVMREGTRKPPP